MDLKQQIMRGTKEIFRSMAGGTTPAPLAKPVAVLSPDGYRSARNGYQDRLNAEKRAFNEALKNVRTAKAARIEAERQRALKRGKDRKKLGAFLGKAVFWVFIAAVIGVNLYFEKGPLEYIYSHDDWINGLWQRLWPSWVAMAAGLLLTAGIDRLAFKEDAYGFGLPALEVSIWWIYAMVLYGIQHSGNVIEKVVLGIIGGGLFAAVVYCIPVLIGGGIALKITGDL